MSVRRDRFITSSGIELPNNFNPDNISEIDHARDIAAPGEFPYTRGERSTLTSLLPSAFS
jgi:hypothetical protein